MSTAQRVCEQEVWNGAEDGASGSGFHASCDPSWLPPRAYYMSPPDLHREICRIVGLVRWGAEGVSEPGLEHLAGTDPDEYEMLQRLLSMGREECAAWLSAGRILAATAVRVGLCLTCCISPET